MDGSPAEVSSPMPRIRAIPMPSRPAMNSQSAQAAPAMVWKVDSKGPTATRLRNPLVGEPPLIQARSAGVAYPNPKVLSANAHRNSNPSTTRKTARNLAAPVVIVRSGARWVRSAGVEPSSRTDSRMAMRCLLLGCSLVSSVAVAPDPAMGRVAQSPWDLRTGFGISLALPRSASQRGARTAWLRSVADARFGRGQARLGALLDAQHHLALHHELHRRLEASHQRVASATDKEPGRVPIDRFKDERPAASRVSGEQLRAGVVDVSQDQGPRWLEQGHRGAGCVPGHPDHAVSDLQVMLAFRQDPVGAVHVAADEVLQPVVAVEAAAALSELDQPGPDACGGRLDGDRVGPHEAGLGDEVVAGPGGLMFLVGGAPLVDPRPRHHDKERRGQEQDQRGKGQNDGCWHDASLNPTTSPRGRGLLQASLRSLACGRATNPALT